MRRVAYMLVVLVLLALLCWPRTISPPALVNPTHAPAMEMAAEEAVEPEEEMDPDLVPDTATDWDELLRETRPSRLPPPSDQGLLRDLEQAVSEIPRTGEAAREAIEIRPEFTPLLPSPNPELEPEPDPDP